MSVNADAVQQALMAAKRWRKELDFANGLQEAAEAVLAGIAHLADMEAAKKATLAALDAEIAKRKAWIASIDAIREETRAKIEGGK
jgi:hypothetical protein